MPKWWSLSARRAWIEISTSLRQALGNLVALRKESVDRNSLMVRLLFSFSASLSARRAWIEINVGFPIAAFLLSLSARRAWIEIETDGILSTGAPMVALRKESVDRNSHRVGIAEIDLASLSARRAWIEMSSICRTRSKPTVALRKESVDRNHVVLVVPSGCWVALRKESVDRNRQAPAS